MVKFVKEYQQATSYHCCDKNQEYQCKVFNNNDLMRKIFQYLTFKKAFLGQLYYCSLVNTCWLYHIWNTKLLYGKHCIDEFLGATWKLSQGGDTGVIYNNVTRSWQRLVNIKSVVFGLRRYLLKGSASNLVLSRLSMLRHVEEIDCHCDDTYLDVIKIIIQQCGEKIRSFKLLIFYDDTSNLSYPVLSPLILPNAKIISISMDFLWFYETWTKECDTLKIHHKIDEKWCKHVIDNCDCSGIKYLLIDYWNVIEQESSDRDEVSISKNNILKQFSQKFVNLQELVVHISPDTIIPAICLLQSVSSTAAVTKNKENHANIHTHVVIPSLLSLEYFDTTNDMIEQLVNINGINKNPIRKLTCEPNAYHISCDQQMKLIKLCHKNLQWLSIDLDRYNIAPQRTLVKFISQCLGNNDENDNNSIHYNLDSLKVLEIKPQQRKQRIKLLILNEIFTSSNVLNYFDQNRIFLHVQQRYPVNNSELDFSQKETSIKKFKDICHIIKSFLIKQIPLDVNLAFYHDSDTNVKFEIELYQKIYQSYFGDDNKLLKEIKQAKSNPYCASLQYPKISTDWSHYIVKLHVFNAKLIN